MRLLKTIAEARDDSHFHRSAGRTLGLVPTMGALHEGHLSLVHAAAAACDAVAVSIFVNPTQFAPGEDFDKYPSNLLEDCRLLEETKAVDFVFAPSVEEMYPPGMSTILEVRELSDRLDGASRPGHYHGVATVVAKLFHILHPHLAFFGQKDAAQAAILRKMVRDLNFEVEMRVVPTVRSAEGLALSSRNQYLSSDGRRHALGLSRALNEVRQRVEAGDYDVASLISHARKLLEHEPSVRLDYFSIVDPDTLEDLSKVRKGALVAVAAFVGPTRLIDNLLL